MVRLKFTFLRQASNEKLNSCSLYTPLYQGSVKGETFSNAIVYQCYISFGTDS